MKLDEKAYIGDLVKIKHSAYKDLMRRFKVNKKVISGAFKVLLKDPGSIDVRSIVNKKKYQLSYGDYTPATFQNYKNDLKAAWSEDMDTKPKRTTVKEIHKWFRGLEENKWRKTYPIDARRINYFVNNHGLNEEEIAEMPKSLRKKNPNASYVREQKYATKFVEQRDKSNKLEEMVRTEIRSILSEILTENADYKNMSIDELADVISSDWKKVNYAAKPYLDAMFSLEKITDDYYQDSGRSVVAYFLSNARSWTGPVAKEVKKELKRRIK